MQIPSMLRQAGASRITFVGGEPFLHPHIEALIIESKAQGLVTAAVTNGSLLDEVGRHCESLETVFASDRVPSLSTAANGSLLDEVRRRSINPIFDSEWL